MLRCRRIVERSWPRGPVDLLLRALLAPEAAARNAWKAWTETRQFDDVTWHEMRLLAPLSLRVRELEPRSPLRPRIDGIARQIWVTSQIALWESAEVFDVLASAGIRFLVFKGAAQYVEGVSPSRRTMGDVDIFVSPAQMTDAIDAIVEAGWSSVNGESQEYLRYLALVRLSGNYRKGQHGEVDLHSNPFHFARLDPDHDEALWHNARPVHLARRMVLVPDGTDGALISLAHAAVSESGDWALDMSARIAAKEIDWERLVETAARRGLVACCLAGLLYLKQELKVPVPTETLATLARVPIPLGDRLKHWSNVRDRSDRNLVEKLANRIADRLLARRGYAYVLKDQRAITVTRPVVPLRWLFGLGQRISTAGSDWALGHELEIGCPIGRRQLVVRLAIRRPTLSRRIFFDVTANGVAIARLRTRSGGRQAGMERRLVFSFQLPLFRREATHIKIRSRPSGFLPPDAGDRLRDELAPVKFKLLNAWVM
jgi:hypothetical protein